LAINWLATGSGVRDANGSKYFPAAELMELVKDRAWLVKMTNALNQHWQTENAAKRKPMEYASAT
jgi:hypothetical protein